MRIFIDRCSVLLFVVKYGTIVRQDLIRYSIIRQYLMQDMIITVKSFLSIEPCSGDDAGCVIYGRVKVPNLTGNLFERRCIHLLQFAEVSTSWPS